MNSPLAIAERIVDLRRSLAAAEAEFQKLVGGAARPRPKPVHRPPTPEDPGVAARTRDLLQAAGRPLTFAEIHINLGDVKREAIKSALKKARDAGLVGFKQFKYFWRAA